MRWQTLNLSEYCAMKLGKTFFEIVYDDDEVRYHIHYLNFYLTSEQCLSNYDSLEAYMKGEEQATTFLYNYSTLVNSSVYANTMEQVTKFYNE